MANVPTFRDFVSSNAFQRLSAPDQSRQISKWAVARHLEARKRYGDAYDPQDLQDFLKEQGVFNASLQSLGKMDDLSITIERNNEINKQISEGENVTTLSELPRGLRDTLEDISINTIGTPLSQVGAFVNFIGHKIDSENITSAGAAAEFIGDALLESNDNAARVKRIQEQRWTDLSAAPEKFVFLLEQSFPYIISGLGPARLLAGLGVGALGRYMTSATLSTIPLMAASFEQNKELFGEDEAFDRAVVAGIAQAGLEAALPTVVSGKIRPSHIIRAFDNSFRRNFLPQFKSLLAAAGIESGTETGQELIQIGAESKSLVDFQKRVQNSGERLREAALAGAILGPVFEAGTIAARRSSIKKLSESGDLVEKAVEEFVPAKPDENNKVQVTEYDDSGDAQSTHQVILVEPKEESLIRAEEYKNFSLSRESFGELAERKLRDSNVRVRRLQQDLIDQLKVSVPDELDVFGDKTQLPKIKAWRKREFWAKTVKPLLEQVSLSDLTLDDIDLYAWAKHAIPYNQHVQAKGFEGDNGSGLSETDVAGIVKAFEEQGKLEKLESFFQQYRAIADNTLGLYEAAGLISKEEKDLIASTFDNTYVPLRRGTPSDNTIIESLKETYERLLGRKTAKTKPPSHRVSVVGEELPRAKGSEKAVLPILAQLVEMRNQAISRIESNRVGLTLARLAIVNPIPGFWTVKESKPTKESVVADNGDLVITHSEEATRTNCIAFKSGGRQFCVELHDPLTVRAIEDLGLSKSIPILRTLTPILSQLITKYNPVFPFRNINRDVIASLIIFQQVRDVLSPEQIQGATTQIVKELPVATRDLYNFLGNLGDGGSRKVKFQKSMEDFFRAGGQAGYFWQEQSLDISKKLKRQLRRMERKGFHRSLNAGPALLDLIERVNEVSDLAIRFATYRALTQRGISNKRAAIEAGEINVDFSKKGEWGPALKSLEMFINPTIQGLWRNSEAVSRSVKARGLMNRFTIALGGMVVLGAAFEYLRNTISEEENEEIQDFEKNTKLIIPHPTRPGESLSFGFLPYGINAFSALGSNFVCYSQGRCTEAEFASKTFAAFADSFLPYGGSEFSISHLSPSVTQPIVEVALEQAWHGGPVSPRKKSIRGTLIPHPQRYWSSTSDWAKFTVNFLSELTATEEKPFGQLITLSPADLEYLVYQYSGGLAKIFIQGIESGAAIANAPSIHDAFFEEGYAKKTHMPLVREVWKEINTEAARKSIVYKMLEESTQKVYSKDDVFRFVNSVERLRDLEIVSEDWANRVSKEFVRNQNEIPQIAAITLRSKVQELSEQAKRRVLTDEEQALIDSELVRLQASGDITEEFAEKIASRIEQRQKQFD